VLEAVGDRDKRFGMNTARAGAVKNLLALAGISEPFAQLDSVTVPNHLAKGTTGERALDILVTLRGEIVHTGSVPDDLRKAHVRNWRTFIEDAAAAVEKASRAECATTLGR